MRNNIFWHICGIGNSEGVVKDQLNLLNQTKLIDIVENIYITYLGNSASDVKWLLDNNSKFILYNHSKNYGLYEKLCLDSLLEWSKNNISNVLYFHTKGVSQPHNPHVWNWRKLLEYFLIDKHQECIKYLEHNDAVGCLLTNGGKDIKIKDENHKYHFSGNFWWSKTEYIKTLPPIPNINMSHNKNYWLCERWILYYYHSMKIHLMYDNPKKHYYDSNPNYTRN